MNDIVQNLTVPLTALYTTNPDTKKTARLTWAVRAGMPRLVYYPSQFLTDPWDPALEMVIAAMDPDTFLATLECMRKVLDPEHNPDDKFSVLCYNSLWENGVKVRNKVLKSTIHISSSSQGALTLSMTCNTNRDIPVIPFEITLSNWHVITTEKNGGQVSDTPMINRMLGKAYIHRIETNVNVVTARYIDTELSSKINDFEVKHDRANSTNTH